MKPLDTIWKQVTRADIAFVVGLLALLPMLYLQAANLSLKPHFQFFPIAWALLAWLVYSRGRLEDADSSMRVFAGSSCWILYVGCAVVSIIYFSPWIAHVALILLFVGWAMLRLGCNRWYQPLAWSLLLVITLPLPRNLDQRLIQRLQMWSSSSASSLLDVVRISHNATGNIIEIRSRPLFVDEACSGVDGLYALAAVGFAIVILQGRNLLPSLIVLATVPVWAWLGNLIRIFAIAILLDIWQIDLTAGWPHTMLGLCTFGLSSICLLLTQSTVTNLFAPFPIRSITSNEVHALYNRVVSLPGKDPTATRSKGNPVARKPVLPFVRRLGTLTSNSVSLASVLIAFLSLAAMAQVGPWKQSAVSLPVFTKSMVDGSFSAESLPSELATMKKVGFGTTQRDIGNINGQYSATWQFVDGDYQVVISLDFPFAGFHGLEECYVLSGGTLLAPIEEIVASGQTQLKDCYLYELRVSKPLTDESYVCYHAFDIKGTPMQNQRRTLALTRQAIPTPSYQSQIYVEGCGSLSDTQIVRYRAALLQASELLLPIIQSMSSGS